MTGRNHGSNFIEPNHSFIIIVVLARKNLLLCLLWLSNKSLHGWWLLKLFNLSKTWKDIHLTFFSMFFCLNLVVFLFNCPSNHLFLGVSFCFILLFIFHWKNIKLYFKNKELLDLPLSRLMSNRKLIIILITIPSYLLLKE